jgi:hypothetical protein
MYGANVVSQEGVEAAVEQLGIKADDAGLTTQRVCCIFYLLLSSGVLVSCLILSEARFVMGMQQREFQLQACC